MSTGAQIPNIFYFIKNGIQYHSTGVQVVSCTLSGDSVLSGSTGLFNPVLCVSQWNLFWQKKNQPISRTGQPLFAVGLHRAWFVPKDSEKGPQCQHQNFSLMSKASFEWHNQNLQKSWMELVWHIPMRLDTSCIEDFLHSTFDVPMGQWPLKHVQYVREAVWFCGHVSHSWGSR